MCYFRSRSGLYKRNGGLLPAVWRLSRCTEHCNHTLPEFTEQMNHHPVRTAQNQSPYQLFFSGMVLNSTTAYSGVRNFLDSRPLTVDPATYGVDEDGPVARPDDIEDGVVVNAPTFQLSVSQHDELCSVIDRVNADDFGISQYAVAS